MTYNKYVIRIIIFITFLLAIAFLNSSYLKTVYLYNKELNSIIFFLFVVGILLTLKNILLIKKEHVWLEGFISKKVSSASYNPILLKDLLEELKSKTNLVLEEKKADILFERVVTKMDFDKEVNKYLIVLLVFLGLLGTFWGLLVTIESVGKTIGELSIEEDNILLTFLSLKEGLKAPLSGMGIAFASSLFGLAASLSLGFTDLQFTKVQNDFLIFLEKQLYSIREKNNLKLSQKDRVSEEYMIALLAQTAEGTINLQKSLEKSENSRKNLENLVENTSNILSKINDEINIRNNQYQKGELVSIEHLRNIENNLEVFRTQNKGENLIEIEELTSQIKLLAKTISLIKK